jgi:hypothetical protein
LTALFGWILLSGIVVAIVVIVPHPDDWARCQQALIGRLGFLLGVLLLHQCHIFCIGIDDITGPDPKLGRALENRLPQGLGFIGLIARAKGNARQRLSSVGICCDRHSLGAYGSKGP